MNSPNPNPFDARPPREIARMVESLGVTKAKTDALTLLLLAGLAGAFISLGALFFNVVVTGATFGFGVNRLLGGSAFSLGLVLVVVAGAELFTGNNLLAMAWASRLISTGAVLRNWGVVYLGNVGGCLATAVVVRLAGIGALGGGAVGAKALEIAQAKCALPPLEAFARGVLCNALVCLAVWLAMGGRTVADKVVAIVLPITAFVTIGFEHSIANWFFLAHAFLLGDGGTFPAAGAAANLLWSTLGNLVGGTVLVAGVYWTAYLRASRVPPDRDRPPA